jgi:hypothetical protein
MGFRLRNQVSWWIKLKNFFCVRRKQLLLRRLRLRYLVENTQKQKFFFLKKSLEFQFRRFPLTVKCCIRGCRKKCVIETIVVTKCLFFQLPYPTFFTFTSFFTCKYSLCSWSIRM